MQGMRFLLLNQQQQPINNGVITQRVTEDRYMCTFLREPQVSRLCHVEEIGTWNLFPNDEQLNQFLLVLQAKAGEEEAPVETPDSEDAAQQ